MLPQTSNAEFILKYCSNFNAPPHLKSQYIFNAFRKEAKDVQQWGESLKKLSSSYDGRDIGEIRSGILAQALVHSSEPKSLAKLAFQQDWPTIEKKGVLRQLYSIEPDYSVQIIAENPTDELSDLAFELFLNYSSVEPEKAGVMLNEMAESLTKDYMIASYARSATTRDPAAADIWRSKIQNSKALEHDASFESYQIRNPKN